MTAESDNIQNSQTAPLVSVEDGEELRISFPDIDWLAPLYNCAKAAERKPDFTGPVGSLDEELQLQSCRACSIGGKVLSAC